MRLRFNYDVRRSVAEELKKASTYGGIGLGSLGYSLNTPCSAIGRIRVVGEVALGHHEYSRDRISRPGLAQQEARQRGN